VGDGRTEGTSDRLHALWAKVGRARPDGDSYHLLLAHMIDVAMATRRLWQDMVPGPARAAVARELGVTVAEAEAWVALWAGAHDLGKGDRIPMAVASAQARSVGKVTGQAIRAVGGGNRGGNPPAADVRGCGV